jgi:hypothetical protein
MPKLELLISLLKKILSFLMCDGVTSKGRISNGRRKKDEKEVFGIWPNMRIGESQ